MRGGGGLESSGVGISRDAVASKATKMEGGECNGSFFFQIGHAFEMLSRAELLGIS
jgi:hypothetical protein